MIAVVYPEFYGVSGIGRYVESFLANLPEGTPTVYLVTADQELPERRYRGVEIIHIPMAKNRFGLTQWSFKARRCVEQLYDEGRISSFNLHIPPLIPGLFVSSRVPMVLTAHTTYYGMSGRNEGNRDFASPWNPAALAIKMWMEHAIFAKARSIITLTEQGRQELAHYGSYKDIAIIPNGVDLARFQMDTSVRKDIDVIFCGRIEKRKGSRPLVEVCKRLATARPSIRIAVVGYGDDEAYVRSSLAPYSEQVELTGKVPFTGMVDYYRRAKVYAATSYYEGLPGTCLEANAMGLPAVVYDFLFYRGLVVEGQTGLLVPPNAHDDMVSRIFALLDDPDAARRMGLAARELVAEHYDWRKLARQVIDVSASIAPAPKRAAQAGQAANAPMGSR